MVFCLRVRHPRITVSESSRSVRSRLQVLQNRLERYAFFHAARLTYHRRRRGMRMSIGQRNNGIKPMRVVSH
ncbi:hypothetical protein BURKHO8Y_70022 [Burkholderia sp. 8Y]|nr:hypothetical protein BURKHO8Y_70022 [Burkholderia sp. 8Y]